MAKSRRRFAPLNPKFSLYWSFTTHCICSKVCSFMSSSSIRILLDSFHPNMRICQLVSSHVCLKRNSKSLLFIYITLNIIKPFTANESTEEILFSENFKRHSWFKLGGKQLGCQMPCDLRVASGGTHPSLGINGNNPHFYVASNRPYSRYSTSLHAL